MSDDKREACTRRNMLAEAIATYKKSLVTDPNPPAFSLTEF